ncbi:hypothetical protein OVA24_12765 [Luteolibacter sp. SL250]|uniref:hypothetical protein n=1 Tax=Luteolibacter sp. SL250 TaxID=2995170 RepID=UPI00226E4A9F|nr:hypothetical protein [Luteolibacter sp. SL250]WAC18110.1 hypothetical protein OVA24_12765 [Luteolibacter sp. SL250]
MNPLTIRCPSCSQKFKVGGELMGRVVECGACEKRFTVNDEVIQKAAKFYPGERNHHALEGFARVEGPKIGIDAATPIPRGMEHGYFSPISRVGPLRLTLGWVGALLILGATIVLQFQFLMADIPVATQMLIAFGVGVIGLILIVSANPRKRTRSLLIGGIAAAILLSVPFVFRSKRTITPLDPTRAEVEETSTPKKESSPEEEGIDQLKKRIGIQPLETEIHRLAQSGSDLRAYGIWLRDMSESNRLFVRDYMLRTAAASPSSVIYPRDNRDYLMVLTGLDKSIEEIAAITARIGQQPKIHPDLQLMEVRVDPSVFLEGPLDKLTDKGSPAFYDLNKRELESIQLTRVKRAVERLADAEPKIYREDITRQLVVLAALPQVDFIDEVCKALMIWAEDPSVANPQLSRRLNQMHSEKKKIPKSLPSMLAKGKAIEALPIMEELWLADATTWEPQMIEFGPAAEKGVLARFPELDPTLRHSAARILARIGGQASIPVLEAAKPKADPELVVLIETAVRSIRERN